MTTWTRTAAARLPGYRTVRRTVGQSLRRSPMAVRVAHAVAGISPAEIEARRPMRFRPGRYFDDADARDLPIVVFVATGVSGEEADLLGRQVEHAQMMTGSFRPLFVVDQADFAPFRSRGYVVERVMDAEELARANPFDSHAEYVFGRVRSIARDYGAISVVPVPAGAVAAMDGVALRLVGAVTPT